MSFYDYTDENSGGKIEIAIFNKCQEEINKLKQRLDKIEKINNDLVEENKNLTTKLQETVIRQRLIKELMVKNDIELDELLKK